MTSTNSARAAIRVLVVDDEAHVRGAIRRLIKLEFPDSEVVEAANGEHALAALAAGDLDVAFLDIRMPGMGGLEAVKQLRSSGNAVPVVIMSGLAREAYEPAATRAGANAFLEKDRIAEELVELIRSRAGTRLMITSEASS